MKRLVSLVFLVAVGAMASACGDDTSDGGSGAAGSGSGGIEPKLSVIESQIFKGSCSLSTSCHGAGGLTPDLSAGKAFGSVVDKASSFEPTKKLVVPGKPDESLLYLVLKDKQGAIGRMPSGGSPLPADKIEAIRAWIAAGAQNN